MKENYVIIILLLILLGCKKERQVEKLESYQIAKSEKSILEIAYPEITGKIVKLGTVNREDIFVTEKNGKYIIDGDMILNQRQIDFFKSPSKKNNGNSIKSTFAFANLWTNGVVYYTINNNVYNSQIILDAITHWEANTTITFVPRTNQPAYVEFVPGSGNSSEIGMQYGMQEITLSSSASVGTAIHEIGHALGLMHEQSRVDRDNYISVNYSNIQSSKKHNFQKYTERGIQGGELGTFDFGSIMMYPSFTGFEINGNIPSITNKYDGSTFTAQRIGLSSDDIDGINFLYNNSNYPYVHVKQVRANYVDNSYGTTNEDHELIDYDIYLEFYADAALTIPLTLSKPILIRCFYSDPFDPFGGYDTYFSFSGVSSVFLDHKHIEKYYWQGNLYYDRTSGSHPVWGLGYMLH